MRTRIPTGGFSFILAATLLGGLPPVAHAVDGVVLIDQASALAGGITPCHNPGFPVTLCLPGSYRLSGNLTVPDENTTAIQITVDNVTLDLNGFSILGPTVCSGSPLACTPTGSGRGVDAAGHRNIAVVNGSVQGMGNIGVVAGGCCARVEKVQATSNGGAGIFALGTVVGNTALFNGGSFGIVGEGTVTGNTATANGSAGISAFGTVTGNTALFNGGTGIVASGTVTGNAVIQNTGVGLMLGDLSGYALNVMFGNGGTVVGGVSLGHNLCNGGVC